MTQTVTTIGRLIELGEPVLIAPHGRDYHDPVVLFRTWAGGAAFASRPRCGARAERFIAVDRLFAELLDRHACGGCAQLTQTTITDAEEASEPVPGPRDTTEGTAP